MVKLFEIFKTFGFTVSWFGLLGSSFNVFKLFNFDTLKPNHCRLLHPTRWMEQQNKTGNAEQIELDLEDRKPRSNRWM